MGALAIGSALLTAGPTLVRAAGRLIGGDTQKVADSVADVVDRVSGKPEAEAEVQRQIESLSSEDRVKLEALAVRVQEIKAETRQAELDHDTAITTQRHETRRAEIASDDSYVRRTRPEMARNSMLVGSAYVLLFETGHALGEATGTTIPGADFYIASLLFAPLFSYIGVRTVDRFSKQGATATEGKPASVLGQLAQRVTGGRR